MKHISVGKVGTFHYSPAVVVGDLCFCAGHLGIRDDGSLAEGLEGQTRQMLQNLLRTLGLAGFEPAQVVKTSLWLRDASDLAIVDRIYREFFSSAPPARTALQIGSLPLDAVVEIDAIACRAG
jgi:Putative translation initiation inhibitor, yjgF family